jgi:hypothetical protein
MGAFLVPEAGMSRRVRCQKPRFQKAEESLKKSLIRESEKTLFGLLFLISKQCVEVDAKNKGFSIQVLTRLFAFE